MTEKDLLIQDLRRENKNLKEEISKLMEEKINLAPCNVCRYEPPSSLGYKPCAYCPATAKENKLKN